MCGDLGINFYGDDFWLFTDSLELSVADYLLAPIDVHFVPLHRLFTLLIYWAAPLDFGLAVGVLAFFQILGVLYLYKTLQELGNSRTNAWLVLVYASNLYLGALLFWWAPGILRLPYIFFAIASVYNYLCYRRSHTASRFLLVVVCFTAALGFFSKAVLIPAYLVGIEVCLFHRSKLRDSLRNGMCIGAVAIVGILYLGFAQTVVNRETLELNLDVSSQLSAQLTFLVILHQGALGFFADFPASTLNWVVSALWLTAIAASIAIAPRNAIFWVVGLGLLVLNIQMIAMSSRMLLVADLLATEHRYYFDLLFVAVLFFAPVLHNLQAARRAPQSLRVRRNVHRVGIALALGIVAISHANFVTAIHTQPQYRNLKRVKGYVENVDRGLETLNRKHPEGFTIGNGRVPLFVLGMLVNLIGKQAQFLPAFGFDSTRVVKPLEADYYINKSGGIMKNTIQVNPR